MAFAVRSADFLATDFLAADCLAETLFGATRTRGVRPADFRAELWVFGAFVFFLAMSLRLSEAGPKGRALRG